MRAREIIVENQTGLSEQAFVMLQKLRKGMAASLKAVTLAEIFTVIPGWTITKSKFMKPSDGGWILKELPGSNYKVYKKINDGRIHYSASVLEEIEGNDHYNVGWRGRDIEKKDHLVNVIFPALQKLSQAKAGKVQIVDLTIHEYVENRRDTVDVSFLLMVQCNGFLITSPDPDGQAYEVYGDYKNGAIDPHTFEMFFHWAVENTNLMESILTVLHMEPHEKKVDYAQVRYVPPPTASEEAKRVYNLLVEMTNGIRAEQKINFIKNLNAVCDRFEKLVASDDMRADEYRKMNPIINHAFNVRKGVNTREPNWEEIIEKDAERSVTEIQNMFVYKNTRKLASILTAKGNMNEPEILDLNCNRGMIMGSIKFTFTDGSSFVVDNSIVQSSMPDSLGRYTYFYRFPTTFHGVVMPDGSKMGQPSEERMNEIFVKA
jgi:hypothetical protein